MYSRVFVFLIIQTNLFASLRDCGVTRWESDVGLGWWVRRVTPI